MDAPRYADSLQLAERVERLMLHLVPQLRVPTEDDSSSARLLHFSLRILSSRMASSSLATTPQSAELARRRLVHAGRASDALKLSGLLPRLERSAHGLAHLPALLQLLVALMNSQPQASLDACAGAALLARPLAPPPPPPLRVDPCAVAPPHEESRIAPPPFKPERTVTNGLSEETLVRELLFVMQGIDGVHIKWEGAKDAFVVPRDTLMPAGARQLVGRLCELGWLYKQVQAYVHEGAGAGLVPQSFRHALQVELTEWFQLIAILEAQRQSSLTLLQLLVWSHQPLQRLITLVQLVRSCGSLKGGAMSVAMARYERHGDPEVAGYVRHLLRQSCSPLLAMVRQWVMRGELLDPHNEFFIEQQAVPLNELWHQRYTLREAMLPSFVSKPLAHTILLVGKVINFIRLGCHDAEWTLTLASSSAPAAAPRDAGAATDRHVIDMPTLEFGREEEMEALVMRASTRANSYLLRLMLDKYMLQQHCLNLKQYLLLGKGDFVQQLMEHLAPQLAKRVSDLHRHQFLSLVESAIRSSASSEPTAEAEVTLLLEHLDVQLLKDPGGSGWDSFSLDYRVESPLSTVLSASALAEYRQAFTFLWRLKRVEHALTGVWRKHGTTARLLQHHFQRDPIMHGCHLLRNEMIHFVCNLQYYLKFEVIECSWDDLLRKLSAASEFEELLAAHREFMAALRSKALLGPETATLHETLKGICDVIVQFSKAQDVLYMSLLEQKAAARQLAATAAVNTAAGRWGCSGDDAAATLGAPRLQPEFGNQLAVYAAKYRECFADFFRQVSRHALLDLEFLSFRLDFNLYYESLRDVHEAAPGST
ncbi:hypothetical protein AB1Y20_010179 [Prymnesium parvum]|uniref:Spindle pole body component n=1 Tax=Prymnesium parvum TaxID=97485 RepID=A0AB34K7M1_PRYPA